MLIETTNYFAKAGGVAEVLAQRQHVTQIRRQLGLPPGRILTKVSGGGPDVAWQCTFASMEDYERDMAIRQASGDFVAARQRMHTLLDRFERYLQLEQD